MPESFTFYNPNQILRTAIYAERNICQFTLTEDGNYCRIEADDVSAALNFINERIRSRVAAAPGGKQRDLKNDAIKLIEFSRSNNDIDAASRKS